MAIRIGLGIHWTNETYEELIEIIDISEKLGYHQLWFTNERFSHDMYVTAAAAAVQTSKPSIGTFVADPYSIHPALTAMAINTLDKVSHGRSILCIGAGATGFPALGITRKKPAKAIEEAVAIIRRLLEGDLVSFSGEVIEFQNDRLNVPTRSNIPIIIASRGDLVLKTAGRVADGAMIATYAEPTGIRHAISRLSRGVQDSGRRLEDLTLISRIDASISDNPDNAIGALKRNVAVFLWTSYPDRSFVTRLGLEVPEDLEAILGRRDYQLAMANAHLVPNEFVDMFCWAGTAEQVAQKVSRVVRLGINNITIVPVKPEGGTMLGVIRDFAEKVKPLVDNEAR